MASSELAIHKGVQLSYGSFQVILQPRNVPLCLMLNLDFDAVNIVF
jgi:hypothetical protein